MDVLSRQTLNKILNKDINDLQAHHISFLKARRSYLDNSQLNKYKHLFEPVKVVKEEKKSTGKITNYNKLQKKAKELGMDKVVGISRKKLEAFVDTALSKI